MSKFRPSRYIMHSDYASVKTYDILTATVSLPATITTYDDDVVYSAVIDLPTHKGIGWRSIIMNDKDSYGVNTPNFLVPCTLNSGGATFTSFLDGEIVRTSASQITMRIIFSGYQWGANIYTNYPRNFTFKIQPYLSPFET